MGNCYSNATLPTNLEVKKLPQFIPPVKQGRVIKVYDGDTVTIASKVIGLKNSEIYKFSVRLNGIDTPEMKTKDVAEKKLAEMAKKALSEKIMGKIIILENVKLEKYGRLLCDIYLDNLHLNKWLLDNRYAISYDGGTKTIPENWLNYYENGII